MANKNIQFVSDNNQKNRRKTIWSSSGWASSVAINA